MFSARAARMAARSLGLCTGSGRPCFEATVISRASLEKSLERSLSWRPLRNMMFLYWECPAMTHLSAAVNSSPSCGVSRGCRGWRNGWAFQLHRVAVGIDHIDRRSRAFGTVAHAGLRHGNAVAVEMDADSRLVERRDLQGEMIDVARFPSGCRTAHLSERS